MSATILSGKDASSALLASLKDKVKELDPKLVVVQVGNDPASDSYIRQKMKSCEAVGMRHEHIHLPDTTTRNELFDLIDRLNKDDDVTGFIVQVPLPGKLEDAVPDVIRTIDPSKDVDGFGPTNLGNLFLGGEFEAFPSATPGGIIAMLEHYKIDVDGKHCVVVGRSNIVGKPLAVMLLNRGATVTVCHRGTKDLAAQTRQADLLFSAVGKPGLITKDMVKPGVIIIDVGTTRTDAGIKGDVDFDAVKEVASAITPVPGGVGPMTVASLIRNCVRAAEKKRRS
ncbi:MAG: bifunctional 5,10-methylenetetrahydrofolate dehydrogenase/5,10-methenyltetrahydrofolate cyclohydrolase [Candidatus Peribacteraceae bacterium]|nr:bifunctional 5,10-methylenetetrahydrofolate dehydrogenase/5,10-methenyltetrahydrofolate cyclohydrolase [Candidatus Peribacteraceae bacterium]